MGSLKFAFFAVIWFVVMIILIIISIRCEDSEEFCWTCQIVVITRTATAKEIIYCTPDTLCGYSERDIMKYENWKTTPPKIINDCGTLKWSECICIKEN